MPRFSKKALSQYLRSQCDRQLKLNLYTNHERKQLGMPEEDKIRGQILLLAEEGKRWQATVLGHLNATFGSTHIIGQRRPQQPNHFDPAPLDLLIQQAQPNRFLVEAKYDIDNSSATFRKSLGIANILDYQGQRLKFAAVVPDLIQVFDPDETPFSYQVTPDGELLMLPPSDSRLQLRIIDVKLTSEPGASYFAEVAYYAMTLAGWLQDQRLDRDFVVIPQAAVWPGSHQASNLRQQMNEWQTKGYSASFPDLIDAMQEDLEIVEFDIFAPLIRRLLREKVPAVLQEPGWQKHPWHVGTYCGACDFLGYPWGQNRATPPTPNPDHCWLTAERQEHLSRVAYISRGSTDVLRSNNIPDVTTLAQQAFTHRAFDAHQELKAQRTVIPSRADALVNGNAFIAPISGTSATMPRWADLKIFISTEFDLSSAISFSFGLKAFWYEPFLSGQGQRQSLQWPPEVFFVGTRSIQQEEDVFLSFLRALQAVMDEVRRQDDSDVQAGRRSRRSTVQFYLWDSVQQEHFMRVVGRHLDAILTDSQLRNLAWLFPPEDLLPDPSSATRQSPITIVSDVVRHHLAAPVPHAYTLLNVVQRYHRPSDAQHVPTVLEYFQDPLSDLIPSERGHEIWIQKQPIPGQFPGYIRRSQQFDETVRKKLRALEMVTSRLRDDLEDQLSNHAAPPINLSSPGRLARAAWDSQLWYNFARLDAALDRLEKQQIRALPPHAREARFKSARLVQRLSGSVEQQVLNRINDRLNLQLRPARGRYVFEMSRESRDVSLKPGDFTYAISPEDQADFLERTIQSLLQGTQLETTYRNSLNDNIWFRGTLEDLFGVTVEAIDRDNGFIVLVKSRYSTIIEDVERVGLADLGHDVILDPVSKDYFTRKLRDALRAIGNPRIAGSNPHVRRAVGMQNNRRSSYTPATPAASFIWDASSMRKARIIRDWKQAARYFQKHQFDLNFSQWRALADALTHRLALIWGPPGSGKSRTLRALVGIAAFEAYTHQPSRPLRILVTAGTYTAIDNVVLKVCDDLAALLPDATYELYRIRSKFQQPEEEVLQRGIDLQLNRYNPSSEILGLRQRLLDRQGITIVGMTPEQTFNFIHVDHNTTGIEEMFDLIVLDEASQMDTAHAILPLCAMARDGCLVLAGDNLQLAPIQKPESPKDLENMVGSVYNFYKHHHSIEPHPLNINYRSNRTIVDFGIRAGYNPSLRAHSPDLRLKLLSPVRATRPVDWPSHLFWSPAWAELIDPSKPVVCFVHDDTQSSQSNPFEADAVSALVWLLRERISATGQQIGLLNDLDELARPKLTASVPYTDNGFWERGVGVVTPHKAQMGRIISSLTNTFPSVDPTFIRNAVDTVERFQGQERDVIIGSFALGDPDAINNEDEFLYDLNRFNVMASRARAKLILLLSQSVVDHLSNDIDTLRASRLLKTYADAYCNQGRRMTLGYLDPAGTLVSRSGRFKYHR